MIPKDILSPSLRLNFAPMVDFLFLTLTVFAVLAVSRSTLFETDVALASATQTVQNSPSSHSISIAVNKKGGYSLITSAGEHPIQDIQLLQKELLAQHAAGNLPRNKQETHILLHIDRDAQWESISDIILSMKEAGFSAYPVYTSN